MNISHASYNALEHNVSTPERIISALAGGWLLYNAITGKHVTVAKAGIGGFLLYRAATGNCPGYSALGKHAVGEHPQNVNIRTAVTVNRPRSEVYTFWRRLEFLPLFMKHLKSVKETGKGRSQWKASIPGIPGTLHWEAEIVKDDPGSLLSWNSLPGASIGNAGKIEFSDAGDNATEVNATITYRAPLGKAGETIGRALNPLFENIVRQDLLNFKQHIESNEIFAIENHPVN